MSDPLEADGLFVYGTLREGGRNAPWLDRTSPSGTCGGWVPGRLFHLPDQGYPAMVAGPLPEEDPPAAGWVRGIFVGYEDEAGLLAALQDLDQLEDTPGGLYERVVLPCRLDSGHPYAAWVYVFPAERLPALERHGVELPDGDWAPYLHADMGS